MARFFIDRPVFAIGIAIVILLGAVAIPGLPLEQGLEPGEHVIVESLLAARPGSVVHPTPYREQAPAGASSGQAGTAE
jgi:hypothetical protein